MWEVAIPLSQDPVFLELLLAKGQGGRYHFLHELDNYIVIYADHYQQAHDAALVRFSTNWSMLYEESNFEPKYFPKGQIGSAINASIEDTFLISKLKEEITS